MPIPPIFCQTIPSFVNPSAPIPPPPITQLRGILLDNLLNLSLVRSAVPLEQVICVRLGRRVGVGIIKKVLNPEENRADGDGRLPGFVFVKDGEANSAGGVNIRVEERRGEFAWELLVGRPV